MGTSYIREKGEIYEDALDFILMQHDKTWLHAAVYLYLKIVTIPYPSVSFTVHICDMTVHQILYMQYTYFHLLAFP